MSAFFRVFRASRGEVGYVGAHRGAAAGRDDQPDGRHTVEYVRRHGGSPLEMIGQPADGMAAVGHAGRQGLADLWATPFRGDGHIA